MTVRGTNLQENLLLPVPSSSTSHKERLAAAKLWLKSAQQAGLQPRMVQQSLANEDAGEWYLSCSTPCGPSAQLAPLPDALWDELFLILEETGNIIPDSELKCWHATVLLDDTGRRAVALRLRLARRSLNLSIASFYEPIQHNSITVSRDASFSEEELSRLCDRHGIPEEWLTTGAPAEIELPV
jgi:hypothetical protein